MFTNFLQQALGAIAPPPAAPPPPFNNFYKVFSVAFANKPSLEDGDKILLPPSALDHLGRLHISYPMMFEIKNPQLGLGMHCGVMEFSAEEGVAYIPYWMMQHLGLVDGALANVRNVTLPKGSYAKLQPHLTKFTQLSNPRVVLEKALRSFSCLTKGSTIMIRHGPEQFLLDIVDLKPANAVSIIETDMQVDFAPPKDYKEDFKRPEPAPASPAPLPIADVALPSDAATATPAEVKSPSASSSGAPSYFARLGSGQRLNGRPVSSPTSPTPGSARPDSASSSPSAAMSPTAAAAAARAARAAAGTGSSPAQLRQDVEYVYSKPTKPGEKPRLLRKVSKPAGFVPFGGAGHVAGTKSGS